MKKISKTLNTGKSSKTGVFSVSSKEDQNRKIKKSAEIFVKNYSQIMRKLAKE